MPAIVRFTFPLLLLPAVQSISLDLVGRSRFLRTNVFKRADIGAFGNGSTSVLNEQDMSYFINITLGGELYEVLIDTGSSDLWVSGDVPNSQNLSIPATLSYASGSAEGFINTADLDLDDFIVENQAFIDAVPSTDLDIEGLVGLGPSSLSSVRHLVNSSAGDPPLDRIFRQNTTTPNYLTLLLSRYYDQLPGGTEPVAGQLTIGAIVPDYEDITNQTKLPVLRDEFNVQHWQTLLDENGIKGPDGQRIETNTTIENPEQGTENQLHVVFDSGFTYPQMTRDIADAIYGRIPGAEYASGFSTPGYWVFPCTYELNISFFFAGVEYPISPLDLSMPLSEGDSTYCGSTYQEIAPSTANHTAFGAFDVILGMAFLRNTYILVNFGDFVDGSADNVSDPYIQLLSVTDPAKAHEDFVNYWLNGTDTTESQEPLVPVSEGQHSPYPSGSEIEGSSEDITARSSSRRRSVSKTPQRPNP